MRVLQINTVYEVLSTGRNVKETHEYLKEQGIESFVACSDLNGLTKNCYQIGNRLDRKIHALLSRIYGLQGYFSFRSTQKLVQYIEKINPDVIILHNLHANYINLNILLRNIAKHNIGVIFVLHDCWFFTGKCVYYSEDNCHRWEDMCGQCPALKKGNKSWFFDRSEKMLLDKKQIYSELGRYAVVGVSKWVTNDAKKSILRNAGEFRCIYNWIDLAQFRPTADETRIRYQYRLEGKFIVLGVAATWSQLKGSHIFYELAELLPDSVKIVMIGQIDSSLQNERILYIDRIQVMSELAAWYATADVFVNPSQQETFGKTTAEALACGTPVVGYGRTATMELIGDDKRCGILVESLTSKDFLQAILAIKENGKKYYSEKCRERAEEMFDEEKNLKHYYELIQMMAE